MRQCALAVEYLESRQLLTAAPQMLANLNTDTYSSASANVADLNGVGLFFAQNQDGATELRRTDGTATGTEFVAELPPDLQATSEIYVAGNHAFFTAIDPSSHYQLWVTDGTQAGTQFVTNPQQAAFFKGHQGDVAYFSVWTGYNNASLWRTDGTAAGTFLVSSIFLDSVGTLAELNGALYFSADSVATGRELWKVKPNDTGVELVRDIVPGPAGSNASGLDRMGDALYFTTGSTGGVYEVWKTDGTSTGTVPAFATPPAWGNVSALIEYDGKLAAITYQAGGLEELWITDGSAAGTQRLATFGQPSQWYGIVVAGDKLFFSRRGATDTTELWVSNGTAAGTHIFQVNPDIQNGVNLTALDGRVYYTAFDDEHGSELWTSNGTAAGTSMVLDLAPGAASALYRYGNYAPYATVNHRLYFNANDDHGSRIYASDGTAVGTQPLAGVEQFESGSAPFQFASAGGKVFFVISRWDAKSLWMTDGNTTTLVSQNDLNGPGPYFFNVLAPDETTYHFTPLGDSLVFIAATIDSDEGSIGLWRVDGSGSTPVEIENFGPLNAVVAAPLMYSNYVNAGGKVYFNATDPDNNSAMQLWVTDGTPEGTGPAPIDVDYADALTSANGLLYFVDESLQLKVSDGTPEGTHALAVTNNYSGSTAIHFARTTGDVYFTALDLNGAMQLWKTNGTEASTTLIKVLGDNWRIPDLPSARMTDVNGRLFFTLEDYSGKQTLWTSDGTAGGTVPLKQFPRVEFASSPESPITDLTAVGDVLYFTADDGVHGREVWRSDGTVAGTYLLTDLNPAALTGSSAKSLANFDGRLYWSADDGVHGQELWTTNGTASGTHLVSDINPGSSGSDADLLTTTPGRLYFSADDGVHGAEPWYLDGNAAGDATGDGFIDGADYTAWADHYLRPGDWGFAQGDFNRDGAVNGADYIVWADHFSVAPASPPAAAALAATTASTVNPTPAIVASAAFEAVEAASTTPAARAEKFEQRPEIAGLASLRWAATVDRLFAQASARDDAGGDVFGANILDRLRRRSGG